MIFCTGGPREVECVVTGSPVYRRVVAVKAYQVTAKRWERGWELHIDGVGVTQSRTVKDAEAMVRDYLHLEGITGPYEVKIDFRAEDDLDAEIRKARRAVADAAGWAP
jgi:hypothetical protein